MGIDEPSRVHYLAPRGNLEQDLRLIEDDKDAVSMCKFNEGGPRDTIILYVENGHAPLAVEVPDGVGQGVDVRGGARAATRGAGVASRGAGVGARATIGAAIGGDASMGVDEDFDWLNEGLEREDFAGDIFSESSPPHRVPSEPNIVPPQPTTDTPQPNTNTPQLNTNTHQLSNVPPPNMDLDEEWAELILKDDIASMDGYNDEQRPGNPEFNERTDMTNVQFVKG